MNVVSSFYIGFAILYLALHPERKLLNNQWVYPGYRWYHTVLKVAPYFFVSCSTHNWPILIVIAADVVFDNLYLYPQNPYSVYWFDLGVFLYTCHHIIHLSYWCVLWWILSVIGIVYRSGMSHTSLILSYAAAIGLRLLVSICNWSAFCGVFVLAVGDIILITDKKSGPIPYKDQLTMGSSYLHVILTYMT
jgi:hypothetical protein